MPVHFRPNIIISGCGVYAEVTLSSLPFSSDLTFFFLKVPESLRLDSIMLKDALFIAPRVRTSSAFRFLEHLISVGFCVGDTNVDDTEMGCQGTVQGLRLLLSTVPMR